MLIRKASLLTLSAMLMAACQARNDESASAAIEPVIDAHHHADWPGKDDQPALEATLAEMDENNIVLTALFITTPDDVENWIEAAPGKFIAGVLLPCPPLTEGTLFCFPDTDGWPDKEWLEAGFQSGAIGGLGEMTLNYYGIPATDPRLDDYWELAAKYDVPVFVHTNAGPPPGAGPRHYDGCCPNFDGAMGDPSLLRPALERYPELRVSLQHSGFPVSAAPGGKDYLEETLSLMRDYPNVYADMTVLNSLWDEESHREALHRFIDEGMADRIMFGTDNQPAASIIARLNSFEFLTDAQRRGILYDNAARFLRLDQETIDAHHGR